MSGRNLASGALYNDPGRLAEDCADNCEYTATHAQARGEIAHLMWDAEERAEKVR